MATVPASVDSAFMEERISGGLPLPSQGRLRCPQQTPETGLPARQPEFSVPWNGCVVCCCETTREDEPCLLRWRGLIMREIGNVGRECVHFSESTTTQVPVCVSVSSFVRGTGVSG